jgi:hypothetical protein
MRLPGVEQENGAVRYGTNTVLDDKRNVRASRFEQYMAMVMSVRYQSPIYLEKQRTTE